MITILCIQVLVVTSLVVASRRRLEGALPVCCFFLVLMPLEAKIVIPGLFDINTMRVCLLTLLILYLSRRGFYSSRHIPLKRLIYLHIGWALFSTIYSISTITSIKQLIAQVLEFYLLYYLLLRIILDIQTIYKILYAMVLAVGVCCIFGLFEVYASWSVLRIFPANLWITYNGGLDPLFIELGRGLRVRSTFPHPILFGVALAMSIPLALYLLSFWDRGWQRITLWTTVPLMLWAVYKTSSRGPWIVVAVSCVVAFLLIQNQVRRYLTWIAVFVLLVVVSRPGIWQTIADLYEATQDSTSDVGASYQYRYALFDAITDAVDEEPGRMLFGYGLGTFREKGLIINFQGVSKRWYTCDDNWAAFLYETGYGGLVILACLLFRPLLMTFQNYRYLPRPENNLSGLFFISLAGFYFSLLSVGAYSWGQQGYMAWILISLSVAYPAIVLRDQQIASMGTERSGGLEEEHDDLYVA
jgi:hypothetical protein